MKAKEVLLKFERKLNLLREYEAALKIPVLNVNLGDSLYINGLKSRVLDEMKSLIFHHPILEDHPEAKRILKRWG